MGKEHLEQAIKALNEKLKLYENIEQEKNIARDSLGQCEEARDHLRESIRDNVQI
jgi:hypothetical protein